MIWRPYPPRHPSLRLFPRIHFVEHLGRVLQLLLRSTTTAELRHPAVSRKAHADGLNDDASDRTALPASRDSAKSRRLSN
uniref:Uncharacterized protein n=1 Tax=Oryza barthii TaxID=65489 RepID=A0A0D3GZ61_9ORYZ